MFFRLAKLFACMSVMISTSAYSLYLDGKGHYSLRGETRTSPGMSSQRGTHQAIDQNFRLEGEARLNDKSSFFLEFKLFEDERDAYLGDSSNPEECAANRNDPNANCDGAYQSTSSPRHRAYTPMVTKAYAKYGFEFCLVEAGRRGRDWGMGIFLDSGNDPFDTSSSVFDGITCDINIQGSQNLGFSVGYDKLSETGADSYVPTGSTYGAQNTTDDLDQYFFTIEYDDRKANAGSSFTKNIGMYFSNIVGKSSDPESGQSNGKGADIKFFDLYLGLFFQNFAIKSEILTRHGKSSDPNYSLYGGAIEQTNDKGIEAANNKLDSMAVAGSFEWTLSSTISSVGSSDYNLGKGSRHLMVFDFAYAPGNGQGYFSEKDVDGNSMSDDLNVFKREGSTSAYAFNRNYKPALILFNGRKEVNDLRVDGVFDPERVMNASVFSLGYRYEQLNGNNFEVKLITAQLNEAIPGAIYDYYKKDVTLTRPVGFYGKDVGYELDLKYWVSIGRQVDLGIAAGYAIAGNAWQTLEGETPKNSMLGQSYISFKF